MRTKTFALFGLLVLATVGIVLPASAERGRGHGHGHDYGYGAPRWHHDGGGRWYHGWHSGRIGWWWIFGNDWRWFALPPYSYEYPPYPYNPYAYGVPNQSPVIVQSAPSQPIQAPPPMWYHCDSPRGYYPYISECATGWRAVPVSPPAGASQSTPLPPPGA